MAYTYVSVDSAGDSNLASCVPQPHGFRRVHAAVRGDGEQSRQGQRRLQQGEGKRSGGILEVRYKGASLTALSRFTTNPEFWRCCGVVTVSVRRGNTAKRIVGKQLVLFFCCTCSTTPADSIVTGANNKGGITSEIRIGVYFRTFVVSPPRGLLLLSSPFLVSPRLVRIAGAKRGQ